MSDITFVLCMEEGGVSVSTSTTFDVPSKMLKFDINYIKNYLAYEMITEQPKVQSALDNLRAGITPTAILTMELRPFKDIPEANLKSVLAECITFLKPPGSRSSNMLPQDYLIDKTNYCSSNIEECVERIETGYLANTKVIKKVYFFIDAESVVAALNAKKRLEFAKLLNGRLSSDSPANCLPVELVQNICIGVKFQGGGGKRKSKKKSKRRITKRKYKRKSRRKSKSKRRRRRSR
jgi:hypothetical protein